MLSTVSNIQIKNELQQNRCPLCFGIRDYANNRLENESWVTLKSSCEHKIYEND